jgi:hypothetical protein
MNAAKYLAIIAECDRNKLGYQQAYKADIDALRQQIDVTGSQRDGRKY